MKVLSSGYKLYAFLKKEFAIPSKELKTLLDSGACTVNGKIETFGSTLLKKGDTVLFNKNHPIRTLIDLKLPILFENKDLYICNKPSGLETAQKSISKALSQEIFLVHRLDKETSGVLILAKNKNTQKEMEILFRKRKVKKEYVALVYGKVKKDCGKIETSLDKKKSYHGQTIWGSSINGQKATTYWSVLERRKASSLILCQPITGRTHQLRVHMSEMGHPILGDLIYGRNLSGLPSMERLCLHAYKVSFQRQGKKSLIEIVAPIPTLFKSK